MSGLIGITSYVKSNLVGRQPVDWPRGELNFDSRRRVQQPSNLVEGKSKLPEAVIEQEGVAQNSWCSLSMLSPH